MNKGIKTVAVSACLLGENCKYSGGNNLNAPLVEWLTDKRVAPICPEVLGGLPTPRPPAEIVCGVVMNSCGQRVHEEFVLGAQRAAEIVEREKADLVILQSRSPSCGVKQIYDGSFSSRKVAGQGIFAAMMIARGIPVLDVEDFASRDKERLMRIARMEAVYDRTGAAVADLIRAAERYRALTDDLDALKSYYTSKEWMADFDADRAGQIPKDMKRGILTEDAIDDLLTDQARMIDLLAQLAKPETEEEKTE